MIIVALFSGAFILFAGIVIGYAFGVRAQPVPPSEDE
jgi:hypothetical protein